MSEQTEEHTPALSVEGLTKRYRATLALDGISLSLDAGAVYGLTGPNGGGKSTLLRILATLERPSGGSIRIHGRDPIAEPRSVRRLIGYGGSAGATTGLTVSEELAFAAQLAGVGRVEREDSVAIMLQLVDLHDRRNRRVEELSRGDLRRLAVARALVHDPLLVLLDGPFDGLDAAARTELRAVLAELATLGKTLLISAAGIAELSGLCDAVGVLDRGRLILSGPTDELLAASDPGRPLRLTVAAGLDAAQAILLAHSLVRDPQPLDDITLLFRFDGDPTSQAQLLADLIAAGVQVAQLAPALDEAEAELARLIRSGT